MQQTATITAARLACVASLAMLAVVATAQPAATGNAPRESVAGVVSGIIGYTRWPVESGPLRLCLLGRGTSLDLLRDVPLGSSQRPVTVQALARAAEASDGCQIVYVAGLDAHATRAALRALSGRPVLLLGEGPEFCSDGGMFCLEPGVSSTRFGANLDAIARSGLRVNPMVLRVAHSASGVRP